ncbi:hypothetical protein [Pseudovibrio ascidiaceicola]|uniref:DUF4376 domain-containing protein n=1 Tax=Pseudovibrio ascidiaceicola TaxID=285279 RepID=UPI000D68D76B|nr:hypothetical protein [Pseudovibrio ascidiaceicola]
MEKGFYHPARGYWQVNDYQPPVEAEPIDDGEGNIITPPRPHHFTDDYPEGTIEVPLKPTPNCKWDEENEAWVKIPVSYARKAVSDEAERRIETGTQVNDIQFRCDDKSLRRLNALMRGFDRGAIGTDGKTYETEAGALITFTTKQQVEAVLNTAEDFESALLERSAKLQQLDPIPDPSKDLLWDLTKTLPEALAALT